MVQVLFIHYEGQPEEHKIHRSTLKLTSLLENQTK